MADNQRLIPRSLMERAVEQIYNRVCSEMPNPELAQTRMAGETRAHAEQMFGRAWHTAHDMNDAHTAHREQQLQMRLSPARQPSGLDQAESERLRRFHADAEKMFEKSVRERQAMIDGLNKAHLIALFTNSGVEKSTAEEIVDKYILK